MFKQVRSGVVVGLLVAMSMGVVAGGASAAPTDNPHAAMPAKVVVTKKPGAARPALKVSAKQVNEGDRLTLTATMKSAKAATRVTLQKWYVPLYYGTPRWEPVKTVKVRGKKNVTFKAVATNENSERYRVTVAYRKTKKAAVSAAVGVTVWRWIPLSQYAAYYTTGGAIFGTTTINGHPYKGWGAADYSHAGAWESRFTPGRHCKSFKAVLGLGDISADGSTGTIAFTADDQPIYTSKTLTPGMSVPVTVSLAKPYRFGVQLFDTTPGGTSERDAVESWPVLGEPAFLCTGV